MKKLLYIGEELSVLRGLKEQTESNFDQVKNVVGFHNQLDKIIDYGLVLSEYKLKGLYGDEIFAKYKKELNENRIPFVIIDRGLGRQQRKELLNKGVVDLYNPRMVSVSSVSDRISFLREMLDFRLSTKRKVAYKDYKIPVEKRIFDIVVAGFALLLLSPLLILTVLAIRLESRGKIFYISKRVGTGYKVFDFYKFRSMYADADKRVAELKHLNQYAEQANAQEEEKVARKNVPVSEESPTLIYKDGSAMSEEEYMEIKKKQQAGTFVKFKNDPRVTKVGAFIRNTSIDELPQLINVLKGDMSIVGNRPLPLYEAEQLTSDDWGERFLAPAGITGLWQVEKRGKGEMSEEERKALDNKYAKDFSFWNDIRLILKTIPALFQKENV